MIVDLIIAVICWLIDSINAGFRYLHESGHPVLSLFLKWNTWMFIPFWLIFIMCGEKLEGNFFSEYSPERNKSDFLVERNYIKHDGWLYTIMYRTNDDVIGPDINEIGYIYVQSHNKIDFREKNDPDYLIMTIKDPFDIVISKTAYDKNGPIHDTIKTYPMLNPYKCSGILTILIVIIMNICLFKYARSVYYPSYRPTKPEDYGIKPDSSAETASHGRINLKKTTDGNR